MGALSSGYAAMSFSRRALAVADSSVLVYTYSWVVSSVISMACAPKLVSGAARSKEMVMASRDALLKLMGKSKLII